MLRLFISLIFVATTTVLVGFLIAFPIVLKGEEVAVSGTAQVRVWPCIIYDLPACRVGNLIRGYGQITRNCTGEYCMVYTGGEIRYTGNFSLCRYPFAAPAFAGCRATMLPSWIAAGPWLASLVALYLAPHDGSHEKITVFLAPVNLILYILDILLSYAVLSCFPEIIMTAMYVAILLLINILIVGVTIHETRGRHLVSAMVMLAAVAMEFVVGLYLRNGLGLYFIIKSLVSIFAQIIYKYKN